MTTSGHAVYSETYGSEVVSCPDPPSDGCGEREEGLGNNQYAGCSNRMQLLPTTCPSLSLAWPHPSRTFAVA